MGESPTRLTESQRKATRHLHSSWGGPGDGAPELKHTNNHEGFHLPSKGNREVSAGMRMILARMLEQLQAAGTGGLPTLVKQFSAQDSGKSRKISAHQFRRVLEESKLLLDTADL